MRVAVALEPATSGAARILAQWRVAWNAAQGGDAEVDLAAGESLAALLDLQARCYDQGLTVTALFPDNQENVTHEQP